MTNTKKKNGNKRKLLGAVGMLTVSAAMLVSSTFAWFSMNKKVTAQTMSITAKADATYLLINESSELATIRSDALSTVTFSEGNTKEVYPAALVAGNNPSADTTAANWYYAEGTAFDDGTLKSGTKVMFSETKKSVANETALTVDDTKPFETRVLKKTVYLALAENSQNATDLTATASIETDGIAGKPTRVVIATSDAYKEFSTTDNAAVTLKDTITNTEVVKVDIYVYYNGDVAEIKTSNMKDIVGKLAQGIKVDFEVTPPAANT